MFLISRIRNNAVDTVSYIGKCSCYLPPKLCYALLVPTSFNMHVKRAKCFMSFVRYPPSMCECLQVQLKLLQISLRRPVAYERNMPFLFSSLNCYRSYAPAVAVPPTPLKAFVFSSTAVQPSTLLRSCTYICPYINIIYLYCLHLHFVWKWVFCLLCCSWLVPWLLNLYLGIAKSRAYICKQLLWFGSEFFSIVYSGTKCMLQIMLFPCSLMCFRLKYASVL